MPILLLNVFIPICCVALSLSLFLYLLNNSVSISVDYCLRVFTPFQSVFNSIDHFINSFHLTFHKNVSVNVILSSLLLIFRHIKLYEKKECFALNAR